MRVSRKRNSRLWKFFVRIRARKGTKAAIVALARKIICILYHLLINQEMYEEEGVQKPNDVKLDRTSSPIEMTVQEMIDIIVGAGYVGQEKKAKRVRIAPSRLMITKSFLCENNRQAPV